MTHPLSMWASQTFDSKLRPWLDSAMVTMASLWETNIALSNGTIDDSLRPPLPPNAPLVMSNFE